MYTFKRIFNFDLSSKLILYIIIQHLKKKISNCLLIHHYSSINYFQSIKQRKAFRVEQCHRIESDKIKLKKKTFTFI